MLEYVVAAAEAAQAVVILEVETPARDHQAHRRQGERLTDHFVEALEERRIPARDQADRVKLIQNENTWPAVG